jgi:DNA-binding MarR family transcriptional regulator
MTEMNEHASATGQLIYDVLRLQPRLIAAGDALTADLGLSSARWQILGTIRSRQQRLTVADIARIFGQSRQSVQRIANDMVRDGLIRSEDNPGHKRSPFLVLTDEGQRIGDEVEMRRIDWTSMLSDRIGGHDPQQAISVLVALREALDI